MKREFTIGRRDAKRADILLSGETVSGLHARIGIDTDGRLWIADLGSTNGTEIIRSGTRKSVGSSPEYIPDGVRLVFGKEEHSVDQIVALFPRQAQPAPSPKASVHTKMIRCARCGSVTPAGSTCIHCGHNPS